MRKEGVSLGRASSIRRPSAHVICWGRGPRPGIGRGAGAHARARTRKDATERAAHLLVRGGHLEGVGANGHVAARRDATKARGGGGLEGEGGGERGHRARESTLRRRGVRCGGADAKVRTGRVCGRRRCRPRGCDCGAVRGMRERRGARSKRPLLRKVSSSERFLKVKSRPSQCGLRGFAKPSVDG